MTIISFQHKIGFIKTTKTAGTSIEADLAARLEPEAVVTPIFPPAAGHEPRNYKNSTGERLFYNHMTAHDIRARLGPELFGDIYWFCVEREPVAKCISHFHMLKNRHDAHGLPAAERDALTWPGYIAEREFPVDHHKYVDLDDGQTVIVDEIINFDDLENRLPALLAERGVPGFKLQQRLKSEYSRTPHIHLADVAPYERSIIQSDFAETLRLCAAMGCRFC